MNRQAAALLLSAGSTLGCGPTVAAVDTSFDSTGGSSDGTDTNTPKTSSGASKGTSGTETGPVLPDCPALCTTLVEGSCVDGQHGAPGCEALCASVLADQFVEARGAFQECVETNPLCFETVEDCIWHTLYPAPIEQSVAYTGSGFESFEGMVVRAGIAHGDGVVGLTQATVLDGSLTVEFTEFLPVLHSRLVLLYVDTDGDATCSVGTDFGHSVSVPITGDFDSPVFELSGSAPDASHDFVCGSL